VNRLGNATVQWPEGQSAGERRPLLVLLHGLGDSGENFARSSDWIGFAAARRVAWVSPDGAFDHTGRRFWNAGPSCCNFDEIPVDHVAALRQLIEGALGSGRVDADKVFVVGFSNGGYMAHRLACELGGLVKAVVSIAGAGPVASLPCPATAPVRVLQIHGDADTVVSYAGGKRIRNGALREYLSAPRTVADWAGRLGCDPAPKTLRHFDFERRLPGDETRVERFDDCRRGAVELWTVQGGRHPIGFHEPAQGAIWQFLDPS
jgi:polyhydroxybutyrate depolymerase